MRPRWYSFDSNITTEGLCESLTCLLSVLLVHSCYDQYSLSCKDYEPCAFYRKHFWCFPRLERRIYTYILSVLLAHSCCNQYSLSCKDYEPRAFCRKNFWCFPRLERRILLHLVCSTSALLLRSIVPFEQGLFI